MGSFTDRGKVFEFYFKKNGKPLSGNSNMSNLL